jgi:hypothetical protein
MSVDEGFWREDLQVPHPTIYRLRWHRKPSLTAYQGKGSRIHRDVNVEVRGVARFVQPTFPFQQSPTWDVNRTEREVLNKGGVGMHGLGWIDERVVRMR